MEDPLPQNIEGSKRVTHSVNHHINWGYVALGIGAIVVVTKLASMVGSSRSEELEEDEPASDQFEVVV